MFAEVATFHDNADRFLPCPPSPLSATSAGAMHPTSAELSFSFMYF